MKTIRKDTPDQVSFIITDLDPKYHPVLEGFYYSPVEEGFARHYPVDTPHLDRIYANFQRYAEEMILQTAGEHPTPWQKALASFCDLTDGKKINWWLTGSAALAIRGIDIQPNDLDLVVDEPSDSLLAELLLDYLVEPLQPSQDWIWNSFTRAFLHVRLEWVGGVNSSADKPEISDFGPGAEQRLETVSWQGYQIRVPPLDLQMAVCQRRGMTDRVSKIEAFLHS